MDIVAGSGNDEFYTPVYAIEPLLKYLKPKSVIWCPFDTDESNFVKVLQFNGHTVIPTHIGMGLDFFDVLNEPSEYDYIISNPPPIRLKQRCLRDYLNLKSLSLCWLV